MADKNNTQPYLAHVLKAIADLKETRGSNLSKIVDHVQRDMEDDFKLRRTRNVTFNIRQALEHAVETGLAKESHGRYKLSLKVPPPSKTTNKPKANPKRRELQPERKNNKKPPLKAFGKGHKKRIRRVGLLPDDDDSDMSSSCLSDTSVETLSPSDSENADMTDFTSLKRRRGRRGSRRRGRRRGSKKRRHRKTSPDHLSLAMGSKANEFTDEPVVKRLCQGSKNNLNSSAKENETEKPAPECDNLDCICNLRKKHDDDSSNPVTTPGEPPAAEPKKTS